MDISDKKFYTIVDDLIPEEQQVFLQKYLCENKRFGWHFHPSTITEDDQKTYEGMNINEYVQFVHSFAYYDKHTIKTEITSPFYNIIEPIIKNFGKKYNYNKIKLWRAKANLQTQSSNIIKDSHCGPHTDLWFPHHVLLYYLNDSDGDTFLFDENKNIIDRITPKKGKAIFFNGDILHASSLPVKSKYRAVINFDMEIL
tara:strand:+ start:7916 stop:8512 length:597 start_codon:yes stop_codon:yes gene_type:complete